MWSLSSWGRCTFEPQLLGEGNKGGRLETEYKAGCLWLLWRHLIDVQLDVIWDRS